MLINFILLYMLLGNLQLQTFVGGTAVLHKYFTNITSCMGRHILCRTTRLKMIHWFHVPVAESAIIKISYQIRYILRLQRQMSYDLT